MIIDRLPNQAIFVLVTLMSALCIDPIKTMGDDEPSKPSAIKQNDGKIIDAGKINLGEPVSLKFDFDFDLEKHWYTVTETEFAVTKKRPLGNQRRIQSSSDPSRLLWKLEGSAFTTLPTRIKIGPNVVRFDIIGRRSRKVVWTGLYRFNVVLPPAKLPTQSSGGDVSLNRDFAVSYLVTQKSGNQAMSELQVISLTEPRVIASRKIPGIVTDAIITDSYVFCILAGRKKIFRVNHQFTNSQLVSLPWEPFSIDQDLRHEVVIRSESQTLTFDELSLIEIKDEPNNPPQTLAEFRARSSSKKVPFLSIEHQQKVFESKALGVSPEMLAKFSFDSSHEMLVFKDATGKKKLSIIGCEHAALSAEFGWVFSIERAAEPLEESKSGYMHYFCARDPDGGRAYIERPIGVFPNLNHDNTEIDFQFYPHLHICQFKLNGIWYSEAGIGAAQVQLKLDRLKRLKKLRQVNYVFVDGARSFVFQELQPGRSSGLSIVGEPDGIKVSTRSQSLLVDTKLLWDKFLKSFRYGIRNGGIVFRQEKTEPVFTIEKIRTNFELETGFKLGPGLIACKTIVFLQVKSRNEIDRFECPLYLIGSEGTLLAKARAQIGDIEPQQTNAPSKSALPVLKQIEIAQADDASQADDSDSVSEREPPRRNDVGKSLSKTGMRSQAKGIVKDIKLSLIEENKTIASDIDKREEELTRRLFELKQEIQRRSKKQ